MDYTIMQYVNSKFPVEYKASRCLINAFKVYHRNVAQAEKWEAGKVLYGPIEMINAYNYKLGAAIRWHQGEEVLAVFVLSPVQRWFGQMQGMALMCSEKHLYAANPEFLHQLCDRKPEITENVCDVLEAYDRKHPRLGLAPYVARYRSILSGETREADYEPKALNVLIPLICCHHKGLELLVKANLYHLAKAMVCRDLELKQAMLKKKNKVPTLLEVDQSTYNNLTEWLGVSQKVLVKLDALCADDKNRYLGARQKGWWQHTGYSRKPHKVLSDVELFQRLSDIQKYNPEYLNHEKLSPCLLQILMENELIHGRKRTPGDYPARKYITGLLKLSDRDIIRILRYANELPKEHWHIYMEYLNICGCCKEYIFGLTPKELLRAYEDAKCMFAFHKDKEYERIFSGIVSERSYAYLETTEEEQAELGGKYVVRVPEMAKDLIREGAAMHNCVADYLPLVSDGTVKIVFVRRAIAEEESFVTVEVDNKGNICQVKAKGNRQAPREVQEFIMRWAEKKHLLIDTNDLSDVA